MALERNAPPNVRRSSSAYVSERRRIEQEYDAKNPDFKHVWAKVETNADELSRSDMVPVKDDDGKLVSDGLQMLCRVPIKSWNERIDGPASRSIERMRSISRNFDSSPAVLGSLVKKRSPKKPGGE